MRKRKPVLSVTKEETVLMRSYLNEFAKIKRVSETLEKSGYTESLANNDFYKENEKRVSLIEWAIEIMEAEEDEDSKRLLEDRFLKGLKRSTIILRNPFLCDRQIDWKILGGINKVTESIKLCGQLGCLEQQDFQAIV